jgi:DeoR/GlpR family transcriptional regulator of sugar metabolism
MPNAKTHNEVYRVLPSFPNDQGETVLPRGQYIRMKMRDQTVAKRCIAERVAAEYVKDFDAVLLDAGSTSELIAEEMFARHQFLSVLTNNMGAYAAYTRARNRRAEINTAESADEERVEGPSVGEPKADESSPNRGNELLITGGRYVDIYESLLGEGAISSINDFTPNVVIIGTSGLRCEEGIFCHGAEESAVKKLLLDKHTDIRLVATDWSKIGKRDANRFGGVADLRMNAKLAVVVTCAPPRSFYDTEPEKAEEFDSQIQWMIARGIRVVKVDVADPRPSASKNGAV